MIVLNEILLDDVSAKAQENDRLRMNYNFHEQMEDKVHRMLNALEPDTYIPPHRHKNPDRVESFLLLRGKIAVFLFNDEGKIVEKVVLDPLQGNYGVDIPAGVWHGLVVLEKKSVIYEIKEGPYVSISQENIAPWAPSLNDQEAVNDFLEALKAEASQTL